MDRSGVLQGSEGSKNHSLREGDVATGDGEVSGTTERIRDCSPIRIHSRKWEKFPRKERMEMKKIRKIMALAMAGALTVTMAVPAFAASIQLTEEPATFKDSHTYKVYQIFTGTITEKTVGEGAEATTVKELSNVKYGQNYGATGSSVPKAELDAVEDARTFANNLLDGNANNGEVKGKDTPVATLTKDNFKADDLAPGYYLIVDSVTGTLADGDVYSQYIVQVLGDVTMETKKDVTEGDKIITGDDHPKTEDGTQNPGISADGKVDNVSIGDTVTFTITAKVPAHASDYDYYYFIINDTLSEGLTLDPTTIAVKTSADKDGDGNGDTLGAADYELYVADALDEADDYKTPDGTKTFQVALEAAKAHAGETITVTYTATLNENATIGGDGNLNTQNVTYSNNPNEDYDGSQDTNNPGKPKSDSTVPVGTTPDATTQTFTSGITLQKLDQDGLALQGASFTIEGDSINKVVKNVESFVEATGAEATYWKLGTGAYTTEEPITADRMDEITGAAVGDDGYVLWQEGDTEEKVTVGGVDYRVVRSDEAPTHILIKKNDQLYDDVAKKYKKTTEEVVEETSAQHISQNLPVNADGTLNLEGLGAGTYTIKETVVPRGYTKAADITVVITFNNSTKQFTATVNGQNATAVNNLFPVEVINVAGNVLPSTGGMGTTMLYVIGAIIIVAAGVLLVTRRKMAANK